MIMLSNKGKKTIDAKGGNSKNLKTKSHVGIKKAKNSNKETPPDELLELTQTWDEDLCE